MSENKKQPTPEQLKKHLDAMWKLYGPKPLKLPKKPKPAMGLVMALILTSVAADELWMQMPHGEYIGPRGQIAMPISGGYLKSNEDLFERNPSGAYNVSTGAAYLISQRGFLGTDGGSGGVLPSGDIYEIGGR